MLGLLESLGLLPYLASNCARLKIGVPPLPLRRPLSWLCSSGCAPVRGDVGMDVSVGVGVGI